MPTTLEFYSYIKNSINDDSPLRNFPSNIVYFFDLIIDANAELAANSFYNILVLAAQGKITVEQNQINGDIGISCAAKNHGI